MATSWAERVLGEVVASGEVCERLTRQADDAYLPIIARLVDASQRFVASCRGCDLIPRDREILRLHIKALDSISPADMAAIEEWKATK